MSVNRLSNWIDLIATIGVVVGMVLLILEIRLNTQAIELQASVNRAAALTEPFYESSQLRNASEKIRTVEGRGSAEAAFIAQYDMTPEEALVWNRHCVQLWLSVVADYEHGNRDLAIRYTKALLSSADQRLFVQNYSFFNSDFRQMLDDILVQQGSPNENTPN